MLKRYLITLGAKTTAGGAVTSASSARSINGAKAALEDDKVFCPKCNSEGVIKLDGPRLTERWNGRHYALNDDLCLCKCSPPPRLVNDQTFAFQSIDTAYHAAQAVRAAELANGPASKLAPSTSDVNDDMSIRLLSPETRMPFKYRPYRLQLTTKSIEGTTDGEGYTQALSAAERAELIAWHVDDTNL